MISRTLRAAGACLVAATFILPALPTMACGPDFSPPVLTLTSRPDGPPDAYAAGRLGIVLPTYVQSYLVIAYRYFSGNPLSAGEQSQFAALWEKYHPSERQQRSATADSSDWENALLVWEQRTNLSVPHATENPQPNNGMATLPQTYQSYSNCYTDAYATAAKTLAARAAEFGESSSAIQSWLRAQVAVFQNCSSPGTATPDPAESSLPEKIQKDRAYQIAAAQFYSGDWDDAQKSFQAISADLSSPWRATAGLVAVRCEIRKATLGTDDPDARDAAFQAADDQVKKIIADPSLASVRNGAEELRGFVEFRLEPERRAVELSDLLQQGAYPHAFAQNLDDYTKLMQMTVMKPDLASQSDMTDWIMRVHLFDAPTTESYSVARWQETHSLVWLVSALLSAKPDTPELPQMLRASEAVPPNSPAYLTLAFDRDRLLAETNKEAQARQDLDRVLAMPRDRIPQSSRNLLTALRMKLARNLDEFLRFAPRTAASSWPDADDLLGTPTQTAAGQPMFAADASIALSESLPVSTLMDAARSNVLPPGLRRQVAIAAWTRAILLRDDTAALRFASTLVDQVPELKEEFVPYLAAQDANSRRFAAILILLRTPGMGPYVGMDFSRAPWFAGAREQLGEIDSFRDNWWSSVAPPKRSNPAQNSVLYELFSPSFRNDAMYLVYSGGYVPKAAFLTKEQQAELDKEWTTLVALPSGPSWLTEQTIARAKAQPDDPRVPEALHLAVRATRYGRSDDKTADYSKQAFEILHRRYSNSEWTKRTPYWFNPELR